MNKLPNSVYEISDFPIPVDEMNKFFDEYVKNNWDKIELNQESFPSYDKQMMIHDSQNAQNLKMSYENDMAKKLANLLEKSIYYCWEQQNWFGDNVSTVLTSDFDDYINWIDIILEFDHLEKNFLWIAADVTFKNNLKSKFDKIKQNMDKWRLSMIKYYNHRDYNWSIKNLPKVIIEIDDDELRDLAKKVYLVTNSRNLWLEKWLKSKLNTDLANSDLQYLVLLQSLSQLLVFRRYAQSKFFQIKKKKIDWDERNYDIIIRRFDQNIKILLNILLEKMEVLKTNWWVDFLQNSTKQSINWIIVRKKEYSKYLKPELFNWRYEELAKLFNDYDFIFKKYSKIWENISENLMIFDDRFN